MFHLFSSSKLYKAATLEGPEGDRWIEVPLYNDGEKDPRKHGAVSNDKN